MYDCKLDSVREFVLQLFIYSSLSYAPVSWNRYEKCSSEQNLPTNNSKAH